jgi:dTMP kinase
MNGVFITFEGIEGCGKTTQARLLVDALDGSGREVIALREPGGSAIAEKIRALLLDPANTGMTPVAELLLYEAARAQLVAEIIRPALERGAVVVCDRFYDSTTAYQGAGRGLRSLEFATLNRLATGGLVPDLTLFLDVSVEIGLDRAKNGADGDRLEREPVEFHNRVRQGFQSIAAAEPHRVRRLDGNRSCEELAAEILELVKETIAAKSAGPSE